MADYCLYCMEKLDENGFCPVGGASHSRFASEPHHIKPGTVLADRFLAGRVLGEGEFGITYMAVDMKLGSKCVIKEYYPRNCAARITGSNVISFSGSRENALAYEKGKQMFLSAAKVMEQAKMPEQVIGVRGHLEANNTVYAVSDFVSGDTLTQVVEARGKLKSDDLFKIIDPLFGAIDNMHAAGLLHHDISPDNIIIDNGRAKLADIGIARYQPYNGSAPESEAKHFCASPEHYGYAPQTARSDIYSLAASVYFGLTGYKPERASKRAEAECLTPPTRFGARISPQQEEILIKAMSLDPNARYESAAAFRSEFLAAAAKPAAAPPRPPVAAAPVKPAKSGGKKKFAIIAAAAVVVIGIVAVIIATSGGGSKIETAPGTEQTQTTTTAAPAETTTPAPETTTPAQTTTKRTTTDTTRPPETDEIPPEDTSETEEDPAETSETEAYVPYIPPTTKQQSSTQTTGDFTISNGTLVRFNGNSGSIEIPSNVTAIGDSAFDGASALFTVTIPSGVTSIGAYAFSDCKNLRSLVLPDTVTTIGDCAFNNCSSLSSITIPANVTVLKPNMFSGCSAMTEIKVKKGNKSYTDVDGVLFNADKTMLISYPRNKAGAYYDVPSGVTKIDDYAFTSCRNIKEITFPSSLKTIGDYAFYKCSSMTAARIEGKISKVGKYAFYKCSKLDNVVFGTSIRFIGADAFKDCDKLSQVKYKGSPAAWQEINLGEIKDGDLGKHLLVIYNYAM